MYPIDKNNQDLLRLLHFLALALVTVQLHPDRLAGSELALAAADDSLRPAFAGDLLSGRVLLSFIGHFVTPKFPDQ